MGLKVWCDMGLSNGEVYHRSGVNSNVYASAFGVGPLGTNPHSCNQTCLDSGNSQ